MLRLRTDKGVSQYESKRHRNAFGSIQLAEPEPVRVSVASLRNMSGERKYHAITFNAARRIGDASAARRSRWVRPRMDNIIAGAVMRTPHADAVASHRFAAGHMVRLSRAIPLRNAAAGYYEVLAQLPERDGDLQYRIKSDREPYQRIVKEGELEQATAQSMPELSSVSRPSAAS